MFHSLVLIGNLGKDPEMRFTPKGTAVTTLSVAVNEGFGKDKYTVWFRVSVWGNQAEACNEYLNTGQQVVVLGTLKPDKETGNPYIFTRKDGSSGTSYEVDAIRVVFGKGGEKQEKEDLDISDIF